MRLTPVPAVIASLSTPAGAPGYDRRRTNEQHRELGLGLVQPAEVDIAEVVVALSAGNSTTK